MLLKYKIDVTLQNGDGHNCLHLAAKNGHFEFLEAILAKDTEGFVNSTTSAGETSLMLAAQKGDVEVAKIWLKYKASVLECDENGWNCLHFAASKGNAKVMLEILNHPDLEKLVDSKTKAGRTALILAAENGYADVVKLLIHKNCNELLCDDEGFSCLHVAAKHGHREVLSHLLSEEGDEDYWDRECLWVGDIESKIRRLDPNSVLLTSKRLKLMEKFYLHRSRHMSKKKVSSGSKGCGSRKQTERSRLVDVQTAIDHHLRFPVEKVLKFGVVLAAGILVRNVHFEIRTNVIVTADENIRG
ncbi:hypothetical protein Mp_6g02190 [Marchantia polymorpha subsp. ruderalis]|uniref:PGG domain-containing protein n=2 Tax=Marchantia polymorpha TaxID=3197 RepID=A0AAF6BMN3_MARPO|nr:hypothetical protein MARPO_0035s0007 [Marchantia polymorpha]BBN13267.1 hypothetical protein Mp_6g02190 [Marchantia polymorpha subsp. ruderalis]|eukprot:PTQ41195.1 hypothetical protein MARPO_0035s0007 [Marchantia polymorpha]